MKQFQHLVVVGVVLVTLLLVLETIDARKKEATKKGVDANNNKIKKPTNIKNTIPKQNIKDQKLKKSNEYETKFNKDFKAKQFKHSGKSEKGSGPKYSKVNDKSKITKSYQKVKKYKIVEDMPAKHFNTNKKPLKINKPEDNKKKEVVDELVKSLKKSSKSPKKIPMKNKYVSEEQISKLNNQNTEDNMIVEEANIDKNPKRKTYKIVDVDLEEEEDLSEGNETAIPNIELEEEDSLTGIQRTESEEVIEKFKTIQTLEVPDLTESSIPHPSETYADEEEEEEVIIDNQDETQEETEPVSSDNISLDEHSYSSRYEGPKTFQSCTLPTENSNRQGPKKITIFVVEEEVDGHIEKRLVSEEDGVTMCELTDLLKGQYDHGL